MKQFWATALLVSSLVLSAATAEAVVWNGPSISFSKASFADPGLEENQDRITDNVWITRASTRGLYNAVTEFSQATDSPADTMWAVGTTADLGSLTFDTWLNTVGLSSTIGGPPSSVGVDFVVHLVSDDIYLDLTIDAWGVGSSAGGSFAYTRSTAVPEPATLSGLLVASGLAAGFTRRRRR